MKKLWIILVMVVALTASTSLAALTTTYGAPTGSGTSRVINGTAYNINITMTGMAADYNITNASFYYSDDGVSFTLLGNATSSTCDTGSSNCTQFAYEGWDTTILSDALTYTIRATLHNITNSVTKNEDQSTVYVDNGVPVCSATTPATGTTVDSTSPTYTVTVVNTTSATLGFGGGSAVTNTYTMSCTANGTSCTYTVVKGDPGDGSYNTVYATLSDGINTTDCTSQTNIIRMYDHSHPLLTETQDIDVKKSTAVTGGSNNNMLIIIFCIVAIIYLMNKGKKKR